MSILISTESQKNIPDISLFVCAIGFEERSRFQIERLIEANKINPDLVLCFSFKDFRNEISEENDQILNRIGIKCVSVSKKDHCKVIDKIISKVNIIQEKYENISVHLDYSSMPRNWYCNIFIALSNGIRKDDKLYFWYSHGDYKSDIKHCSTAGTDDFVIFSGKASTKPRNRSHIFGIGYDYIKSDAIRTIVDPTTLVVCYTYPKEDLQISNVVKKAHKYLLDSAAFNFSVPLDDFNFMVKRITEIVIDLYDKGDVILIPDGPKPLILACSIIPILLNKIGIVAFHVQSHKNFAPENIKPSGTVSGFSVKIVANENM